MRKSARMVWVVCSLTVSGCVLGSRSSEVGKAAVPPVVDTPSDGSSGVSSGGAAGTGGGATAGAASAGSTGSSAGSTGSSAGSTGSTAAPSFAVTPDNARSDYSGKIQFTVVAVGLATSASTWSVVEGASGGSVDANGLYTAPPVTGTFHVSAKRVADPQLTSVVSVNVTAPSGSPPTLVPGTWANLTEADIHITCCPSVGNSYGIAQFEIDRGNPRTLYACVDQLGLWKTSDGGSHWAVLGDIHGMSANVSTTYLDSPVAIRVDPTDSTHLYATQGVRGVTMGFWVSHDAGQTWVMPPGFVTISKTTTRDVTTLAVDPADFKHILVGSHSAWPPLDNAGILESKDGGDSWAAHDPVSSWAGGSVGIHFLYSPTLGKGNSQTWLIGVDGGGFWRTTDSGGNWDQVVSSTDSDVPHGGDQGYYSPTGWFYAGASPHPIRSSDNGVHWQSLDKLPAFYYYSVYGDGTHLYSQWAYTGISEKDPSPFYFATESDGLDWAPMPGGQTFVDGPYMMLYDAANKIIYSASWSVGLLALFVP